MFTKYANRQESTQKIAFAMKTIEKKRIASIKVKRKALTVQEVADMLAVTPLTIRRAIKNGKFKAMRIAANGRYRIAVKELDEFIRKNSR